LSVFIIISWIKQEIIIITSTDNSCHCSAIFARISSKFTRL